MKEKVSDGNFKYERKYSIKELFNPKKIYNSFRTIEFRNLQAFISFIGFEYLDREDTNREFIVNVKTVEEIELLCILLKSTDLTTVAHVCIAPNTEALVRSIDLLDDSLKNCSIRVKPEDFDMLSSAVAREESLIRKFFVYNYLWVQTRFTPDNLNELYEKVVTSLLNFPRPGLLDLTFDYAAWEKMPMSDLHRLRFFCGNIRNWLKQKTNLMSVWIIEDDKVVMKGTSYTSWQVKNKETCLKAYLDENLDIYLDSDSVEPYFKMSNYKEKDGNQIDLAPMTKIRQIIDVKFKKADFKNMYLLDLSQNIKIMRDPYIIPYITNLIGSWLEI